MRKLFFVLLGLGIGSTGVAGTVPLKNEDLAKYAGKTVASTAHPVPSFAVIKTTNMMFGLVGLLAGRGAGNEMVKANGIEDPAIRIGQALAQSLSANLKANTQATPSVISNPDGIAAVVASVPGADVVVDVQTVGWGMNYLATSWGRYMVGYQGKLRVIDTATMVVLAESTCNLRPTDPRGATEDQLLANGAALLKFYYQQAQFGCTDQFAKAVFGFAPPSRPVDALANPLRNIKVDDVEAIPDLNAKGRDEYKAWLAFTGAKAFAIATNGYWGKATGIKPTDQSLPIEPVERALLNCKRYSKQTCQLYAVNGKVVYNTDFAARAEAMFEKAKPTSNSIATSASAEPVAAPYSPSGFADVDEVDLVPYLSEKGRADYAIWLKWPQPKAFALSPSGYYAHVSGTAPKDPSMPSDPIERALAYCQKNSPTPCKIYALNSDVVYNKD